MEEFLVSQLGEEEGRRIAKLAEARIEELSAKAPAKRTDRDFTLVCRGLG